MQPTGPDTLVLIHLNGVPVTCRVHPEAPARPGQLLNLMFDLSKLVFFDPQTREADRLGLDLSCYWRPDDLSLKRRAQGPRESAKCRQL